MQIPASCEQKQKRFFLHNNRDGIQLSLLSNRYVSTMSCRSATIAFLVTAVAGGAEGFAVPPQPSSTFFTRQPTELAFGLPSFQPKTGKDDEPEDPKLEKSKIGLKGLVQLITAGAGAPFLGDFQASRTT